MHTSGWLAQNCKEFPVMFCMCVLCIILWKEDVFYTRWHSCLYIIYRWVIWFYKIRFIFTVREGRIYALLFMNFFIFKSYLLCIFVPDWWNHLWKSFKEISCFFVTWDIRIGNMVTSVRFINGRDAKLKTKTRNFFTNIHIIHYPFLSIERLAHPRHQLVGHADNSISLISS